MYDVDEHWTPERVWAAQEDWHEANPDVPFHEFSAAPLALWVRAMERVDKKWAAERVVEHERSASRQSASGLVETIREIIEEGEGQPLLLRALHLCAKNDLPLPEWLRKEFVDRFERVYDLDLTSWDDVFGKPHPKGRHLGRTRQRKKLAKPVFKRVKYLLRAEPDTPKDDGLFDRVAAEFGIGRTRCKEFYYEEKEWHPFEGNASRPPPLSRKS